MADAPPVEAAPPPPSHAPAHAPAPVQAPPTVGVSRTGTDITLEVPHMRTPHNGKVGGDQSGPSSRPMSRAGSPAPSQLLSHVFSIGGHFDGPRDLERHSKLPLFMRISGSVVPKLIVPLVVVAAWSTAITVLSDRVYPLEVSSVLLTVLGFVIGLAISFRTSTAYERYSDGRKFWTEVLQASRDLSRHIWIHVDERHEQDPALGRADLLGKVTALNLVLAYAVALKHKLRFEPYVNHDDLEHLVTHLQTYAGEAVDPDNKGKNKSSMKRVGEYLDLSFAHSNPRKAIKRSKKNLGNLPLEILLYLSAYLSGVKKNGTLDAGAYSMFLANVQTLNSAMAGSERVLNTPLPMAYSIAISQITWVYILVLPFQLFSTLGWVTIPGCIVAAYVILGMAYIGMEIENPFGSDQNDLPLDQFCHTLAQEIDVICSRPQFQMDDFVTHKDNTPIFGRPFAMWHGRTTQEVRDTLRLKATVAKMANDPIESEKLYNGSTQSV